ncbi:basement membrane-specific heparan sulfate proteoglycan core protein, partial [Cottoperca gobio]|uniref:Basement membrane-specific heparan sulfate proteoglycan core protein n=1 Tax=Cottoperca gobio TaxID=56716 RepID=A0A6J2PBQ5_COTGO
MGSATPRICGLILCVILTGQLTVSQASKVWGEVPLPEDLEEDVQASRSLLDDDEDFAADEASGDLPSGEDDGSTPWPPVSESTIYYRALVNFTDSLVYGPELEDIFSSAFNEISEAVVDTLESDYNRIPGVQTVSVVLIKKMIREDGVDVFVELDVGSDYNNNDEQIRSVLYNVVKEGAIASYITSVQGFQFRQLGEEKPLPPVEPLAVPVTPGIRPCMSDEHRCGDGTCILMEYLCDNRPDCRDMSDENNCDTNPPDPPLTTTTTTSTTTIKKPPRPPSPPGPCRADQATCQSGECIPRDYVCDGEADCSDGSDEFRCGTPSPCEPNEFKCKNGRCALKLWRCDGDNDCEDNSDETDCPTKGPGDRCAPEQFECLSDRTCIPASYQCDDEPDCPDRSDEYGCTPPSVTSPPEESIQAARGATVTFTCQAVGVPTPIITWRLNWGHIPLSGRISMTSENGRGSLTIRDVKEADQGAYTCEAINAKGLVFGIPDGVLTLTTGPNPGNCSAGHFSVEGRCVSCFCAGLSKNCKNTGRYRNQISLRFTEEENFKGVNVTYPSRPGTPPLSSTQLLINPEMEEFQLVDLSRRFLNLDSFWTLPRQFLGNKIESYGGSLKFKVRYTLARGLSEPVEKPDVTLVGNGRRLVYRRGSPAPPGLLNQREVKFTEDKWQHSNGRAVSREELMMTLAGLDSMSVRTVYDNHMVSVALSDIVMETTTVDFSILGHVKGVEECRCPPGYSGLSCETCSSGFERVPGGSYLGTCAGCNCNGHASACDPISGHCLSCQHYTEGSQCDKCRSGYFGDPSRGRPDDCKPCPCPYYETSRRFSDSCFLDVDLQPTCDACRPGYTGRRCEKCSPGYQGNPLLPNGHCVAITGAKCDNKGSISSSSRPCSCKNNVAGDLCDECKAGFFHLSERPEGCLQCFCMGVTKQCSSSTWSRDQVRGGVSGQLFSLSNSGSTKTISEGISQRGSSEVVFRSFSSVPRDIYYWLLPDSFRGDKVTAYGGELRYTVSFEPFQRSLVIDGQPDVVLQGNGIFLEHFSHNKPQPRVPQAVSVTFRESAWRRADGQPCTREHLLMALADVSVFMIRATYADNMAESSISDIQMDVAVPRSTGNERAVEVEECVCPKGYRGPSCQDCDAGYTRTSSGLYLGTCERCDCNGHASSCDTESGKCL